MIARDATAVELLAELIDRLAASERAAEARHAELLRRVAQAEDAAACASIDASGARSALRRLLEEY